MTADGVNHIVDMTQRKVQEISDKFDEYFTASLIEELKRQNNRTRLIFVDNGANRNLHRVSPDYARMTLGKSYVIKLAHLDGRFPRVKVEDDSGKLVMLSPERFMEPGLRCQVVLANLRAKRGE